MMANLLTYHVIAFLMMMIQHKHVTSHSMVVVDLTHEWGENSVYWPGMPRLNVTVLYKEQTPNYWFEANAFQAAEHGGTHMDAPAHLYKGSHHMHQIPVEKLIGPGVIVNVKEKAALDPDYRVQIEDFEAWESRNGRIPDGAIVLMNSGWSSKYYDLSQYFGTNETENSATFHFPGYHEDAVDWLVTYRRVHVIGVDTPSTDYGQSETFPSHQVLGRENIPGLENVANLDRIPESGAMIYVGAVKLYEGSGGPVRIIATFSTEKEINHGNRCSINGYLFLFIMFVFFCTYHV